MRADPPCWSDTARFVDCGNGTVTDQATGLIWIANAACPIGGTHAGRRAGVTALADGQCGLSDNSSAGAWRLPTLAEFEATWDPTCPTPSFPDAAGTGCVSDSGDTPFIFPPMVTSAFLTSTLDPADITNVIVMNLGNGTTFTFPRTGNPSARPWAVRSR